MPSSDKGRKESACASPSASDWQWGDEQDWSDAESEIQQELTPYQHWCIEQVRLRREERSAREKHAPSP